MEAERARCLRLLIDGREIPHFTPPSVSTPQVFEVTDCLEGWHNLTLLSDNSYPSLPHDAIVYSSAATDETQTNWNGLLGYFRLREEEPVFLESIRAYPKSDKLTVCLTISADAPWAGEVSLTSEALAAPSSQKASGGAGFTELLFEALPLSPKAARWDEEEGNLHTLTVRLFNSEKTVTFGIRDFGSKDGRLAFNGRVIFLRGEANCAVFPETGHPPMDKEEWLKILRVYQSYGVNCMRFHSHCPPEGAFEAADQLGMLMQPELSHWNPDDAFESDESFLYYQTELSAILKMLANHPSFVMLTFGNELQTHEKGLQRMEELLKAARRTDPTRLYANASNPFYGSRGFDPNSDFYTATNHFKAALRGIFAGMKGYINESYPSAARNFDQTMKEMRQEFSKPVFGFEVGQFEVLPDFDELEDFHGVCEPVNYQKIQERVAEKGLLPAWKRYVEATGELSRIGYREEVEAVLRTKEMSGLSLLGLQDFPGQGTALVGMLNAHLQPKPFPFAQPKAFQAFFRSQLPLALLPRYTYENTETLSAEIKIANYGKTALRGPLCCRLSGPDFAAEQQLGERNCPAGALTHAGYLNLPLTAVQKPSRLTLTLTIGSLSNQYPIWVYPPVIPACPEKVYETVHWDEKAKAALLAGKVIYLSPPSTEEALPRSIQAQFTTDFWSVGTFSRQSGAMGQLIDEKHPIFKAFPTEFHTNWQWWPMASRRAVILPKAYQTIITEMDSYAYLRPMMQLMEFRCGGGKVLFSSMDLASLQQYPEGRALQAAIYQYMDSEHFQPVQEMPEEVLKTLVR